MKKIRTFALLGLLAAGTVPQLAHATSPSYTKDDLFVAFKSSSSSQDYLVDIGQASNYQGLSSGFTLTTSNGTSLGNIGADLAAVFGDDWSTSADLSWTIFAGVPNGQTASNGDVANTIYASAMEGTYGTETTPWNRAGSITQATTTGKITSVATGAPGGFTSDSVTANSNVAVIQSTSDANSYVGKNPMSAYNSPGQSADGILSTQLDLFKMAPGTGAGSYIGSFTIDDGGNMDFSLSPQSVPEPSSTALISIGVGLVALIVRRRRAAL